MNRYEGSPAIVIERRKGTPDSPFSDMNESLVVASDGKVVLTEIPNELNRVIVTSDDNTTWYEITNGQVPLNGFKVDYINKLVTFNIANVGKQLHFKYFGEGNHYYSLHTIYTKLEEGSVVETLGDLIENGTDALDALGKLDQKLDEVNQATNNAIIATNDTKDVISQGEQVVTTANSKIDEIANKITEANDKILIVDNTIVNANNAIDNANDATLLANNAALMAQNASTTIMGWGTAIEWISGTYNKNNIVTRNGNTYQSRKDNVVSIPPSPAVTNDDWIVLAVRGVDGTGAVSTVNGEPPDVNGNVEVNSDWNDIENKPMMFPPSTHTHEISNVIGLQDNLDEKANNAEMEILNNIVTEHLMDTERCFNLASYMRDKTSIEALQQILLEIGTTTSDNRATIYIPAGIYDFENITESFVLPSFVTVRGDSSNTSLLLVQNNEMFSIGSASKFIGDVVFKDIQFYCDINKVPNTNQVCVSIRNGGDVMFDSVQFSNVATVLVGGTESLACHNVRFVNLKGYLHNLGTPAFKLTNGTGLFLQGGFFINGTNTPVHGELMNTLEGSDLIVINGNWDTLEIKGIYERFYRVLYGKTNGKVIQNVELDGVFDYIRQSCIDLESNNVLGGITGIKITNSWVFCWEGSSIKIRNPYSLIRNVSVSNCDITCSGSRAVELHGVKSFVVDNNRISGTGQKDADMNGIFIEGACEHFVISANVLSHAPETGITWGSTPWIYIDPLCDKYNMNGNTAWGYILPTPTVSSKNRLVKDNVQWGNDIDGRYDKQYTHSFPLDGVDFVNPYAFEIEIYVSGNLSNLFKNGIQLYNESSNVFIRLKPGEKIKLTKNGTVSWIVVGVA